MTDTTPGVPVGQAVSDEQQAAYVAALTAHDWAFDYSEDMRVVRAGRAERAALREAQQRLDPDFAVWNSIAPTDYQVHVVAPAAGNKPAAS